MHEIIRTALANEAAAQLRGAAARRPPRTLQRTAPRPTPSHRLRRVFA